MKIRRISIVEDDPALLETVSAYLDGRDSIEVAGRFGSAEAALKSLRDPAPDLFIVDLQLPGMNGIELIRKMKSETPSVKIIAYTGNEDRDSILSAIKAGASGYVIKGEAPQELLEGIEEVCRGGAPLSPSASKTVVNHLQLSHEGDPFLLSAREKNILASVRDGLTYDEIGERFHISPHTVHSHVKRIFKKLEASNRKEALEIAFKKGIL